MGRWSPRSRFKVRVGGWSPRFKVRVGGWSPRSRFKVRVGGRSPRSGFKASQYLSHGILHSSVAKEVIVHEDTRQC